MTKNNHVALKNFYRGFKIQKFQYDAHKNNEFHIAVALYPQSTNLMTTVIAIKKILIFYEAYILGFHLVST